MRVLSLVRGCLLGEKDSESTHFECSVVMPFNETMLYILHSCKRCVRMKKKNGGKTGVACSITVLWFAADGLVSTKDSHNLNVG